MLPTIEWKNDAVVMIDQRKLPALEIYVSCRTAQEVARAIKTMVIRGATAIGVAAAMCIALGTRRSKATGTKQFATEFQRLCDLMAATRPTAVNRCLGRDHVRANAPRPLRVAGFLDDSGRGLVARRLDAQGDHDRRQVAGGRRQELAVAQGTGQRYWNPRRSLLPPTATCPLPPAPC